MGPISRFVITGLAACATVLSLAGCEARVSLGVQCTTRSDCPDELVCRQGRCRVECREARDCTFPLECIVEGIANAGGCRVPEDGSCRIDEDCAGELVCEGSVCVQPCTDHSECAVAQVCNGRGCVRNTIIGPCDVLSGTGCEPGERCGIVGMGMDRRVECLTLALGEVRDGELGDACDGNPDTLVRPCRDGMTCVDGRCLRWCLYDHDTDTVDSNCGPGSTCVVSYAGSTAPVTCGFCSEGCDPTAPVADGGCPAGRACGLAQLSGDVSIGECEVPADVDCTDPSRDGCLLRPCVDGYACAPGLDCGSELQGVGVASLCIDRCDVDTDCPTNFRCEPSARVQVTIADGSVLPVGVCVPTCGVDATDPMAPVTTRECPGAALDASLGCDVHHAIDDGTGPASAYAYCMPSCDPAMGADGDCHPVHSCDVDHGTCTPGA